MKLLITYGCSLSLLGAVYKFRCAVKKPPYVQSLFHLMHCQPLRPGTVVSLIPELSKWSVPQQYVTRESRLFRFSSLRHIFIDAFSRIREQSLTRPRTRSMLSSYPLRAPNKHRNKRSPPLLSLHRGLPAQPQPRPRPILPAHALFQNHQHPFTDRSEQFGVCP